MLDGEKGFLRSVAVANEGFDFLVWEFPQMRIHNSSRSLADEEASAFVDDKSVESSRSGGGALGDLGELVDAICFES